MFLHYVAYVTRLLTSSSSSPLQKVLALLLGSINLSERTGHRRTHLALSLSVTVDLPILMLLLLSDIESDEFSGDGSYISRLLKAPSLTRTSTSFDHKPLPTSSMGAREI